MIWGINDITREPNHIHAAIRAAAKVSNTRILLMISSYGRNAIWLQVPSMRQEVRPHPIEQVLRTINVPTANSEQPFPTICFAGLWEELTAFKRRLLTLHTWTLLGENPFSCEHPPCKNGLNKTQLVHHIRFYSPFRFYYRSFPSEFRWEAKRITFESRVWSIISEIKLGASHSDAESFKKEIPSSTKTERTLIKN